MRKIGYSVGLEQTLQRIVETAQVYVRDGQLTPTAWSHLVHQSWGLKNDNIGDVFNSLGILVRTKTRLDPMAGLDLFGIILSQWGTEQGSKGLALAFLNAIIEHDGEIFLNCLLGDFIDAEIVLRLEAAINYKRSILFRLFKNPEIQAQIGRAVGIDRQFTNTGGSGKAKSLSDTKRTGRLEKRSESLKGPGVPPVEISDDYLRKVPPRRRDWATSIGLFDPALGLTGSGRALVRELERADLLIPPGAAVLWPFTHEISRFRINPLSFECRSIEYWDLVRMAAIGAGGTVKAGFTASDRHRVIELIVDQLSIYHKLNRPKSMLRRELPLTLALPALAAAFVVEEREVPDLAELLESERTSGTSKLEVRSSRNSIGAIAVR